MEDKNSNLDINDKNYIDYESTDGYVNNFYRQMYKDLETMSDAEWAAKYPEHCGEWLTDDELLEYKPMFMYQLEQSLLYIEEGGYIPKRDGGGLVKSDLRINHPPNTVKSTILTLRSDHCPTNAPENDPDDGNPVIYAWEADDGDFFPVNLRRIHQVFNMNLKKWNMDQHWLLYKLGKYEGTLTYIEEEEVEILKDRLFPSIKSQKYHDIKKVEDQLVTLKKEEIPYEIEQEEMPLDGSQKDPEAKITVWNKTKEEWLTIRIGQIYNLDVDEIREIEPIGGSKPRPSNWEELRDSIEKEPRWDDE